MFAHPMTRRFTLLALTLLLPLAVSCSGDDATGPSSDPLVGTWQVTSFQALGIDVIQQGMTMKLTLSASKSYTIVITNDAIGSCENATTCTDTGIFSSTSTQITMDPGTTNEITFSYVINGSTMTFTGNIDDVPVTVVLQKT